MEQLDKIKRVPKRKRSLKKTQKFSNKTKKIQAFIFSVHIIELLQNVGKISRIKNIHHGHSF